MLNYFFEPAKALARLIMVAMWAIAASSLALGQTPANRDELVARYKAADSIASQVRGKVFGLEVQPQWIDGGKQFWFRWDGSRPARFLLVDSRSGSVSPLFDDKRLGDALKAVTGSRDVSGLSVVEVSAGAATVDLQVQGKGWRLDLKNYALNERQLPSRPKPPREDWNQSLNPPDRSTVVSPDGKWAATIEGLSVVIQSPQGVKRVAATGVPADYFARLQWSPDSKTLVATKVQPGDRKHYMYILETPPGGGLPKLVSRLYDRPGDKIDTFSLTSIDPVSNQEQAIDVPRVEYGDMPGLHWLHDGHSFTLEEMARGFGSFSLFKVDAATGKSQRIVFENPKTFVDSTQQFIHYLADDSFVWLSERDGLAHLYHIDKDGVVLSRITAGQWVVRKVVRVDEKNGRIVFEASGVHPGEDPYFIHYFSVGLDGKGLVELTPETGNHNAELSPDGETLVDTFSTINTAPKHILRRVSNGSAVCALGEADDSGLRKSGWRFTEPFVAKGRDGKTDIYGIAVRPQNWSPDKKYPLIEYIYAGPHDSFVRKSYVPSSFMNSLAELGFVVVQIDGMGTRNRGKAFQDVCYKNVKDAGFPDRILWMQALAAKDPSLDLTRVGIYGTSAGGQSSTGAVLFHPEFYKVAVSSCGCHDNRLDKLWWNEQWMGYPVGPEYSASSNIDNAAKLQGHLMLIVGEADNNVPPESTYRLAAALQKAGKDFELVVIPNADHTDGGPYGDRKRRDFFVRHLFGFEPPQWTLQRSGG